MTSETTDLADKIAARIADEYAIGTFSRFMDEPADFDAVELGELAKVIREVIKQEKANV